MRTVSVHFGSLGENGSPNPTRRPPHAFSPQVMMCALVAITATPLRLSSLTTIPDPLLVRRRGCLPRGQTISSPSMMTVAYHASMACSGNPSDETLKPSGEHSAIPTLALAEGAQRIPAARIAGHMSRCRYRHAVSISGISSALSTERRSLRGGWVTAVAVNCVRVKRLNGSETRSIPKGRAGSPVAHMIEDSPRPSPRSLKPDSSNSSTIAGLIPRTLAINWWASASLPSASKVSARSRLLYATTQLG